MINPRTVVGVASAVLLLVLTGCGDPQPTVVSGRAVSMLYNPGRVGGLPATDGPSGPRGALPAVTARVQNSDGGVIDQLAELAIDDIEDFWTQHFSESLSGTFQPVGTLVSYDSTDRRSPEICGAETYQMINAFFCPPKDLMAWDRGVMLAKGRKYFGDMSIAATLAHEYGHSVSYQADSVSRRTPTLVKEQQADCYAGVYLQWVAAGSSSRHTLSTGNGLNYLLAGLITLRDPISTDENYIDSSDAHGNALDRVSAFQLGFDGGAESCAKIDADEVEQRRGDLPEHLFVESAQSDLTIDADVLATLMTQLGRIFGPADPPQLSTSPGSCSSGQRAEPAAYCAGSNTVVVDLPALQELSVPSDQSSMTELPNGDNTGLSIVTSRYVLAVQQQRGVALESASAALRTACLTGVAQRRMATASADDEMSLGGGDLDEAVTGLLVNGLAASDVNGNTVPAGFTRILAFRSGLNSDADQCFARFP